jgi:hypothetical protein
MCAPPPYPFLPAVRWADDATLFYVVKDHLDRPYKVRAVNVLSIVLSVLKDHPVVSPLKS